MFTSAARYAPALQQKRKEKRIPVVGPSSVYSSAVSLDARSFSQIPINIERSVNLFPVKPEREGELWVLRRRPGLELFATLPRTPIRGRLVHDNRYFCVAGPRVYEVYENGDYKDWGAIGSLTGKVQMASLLSVIVIGDGAKYYALDLVAGTVTQIVDAPRGRFPVFFNQRILYQGENGQVFYSELNDATNIPGANFFTAESLPDDIVAITTTEDQIWLHGGKSTEPWYDSGDADNPFQRIQGGVMKNGCLSGDTALVLDNSVWWVGQDDFGKGIVWRSNGFSPQRVSTSAVERFTKTATNLSAYCYQEEGHSFYVLNADQGSWAFDIKVQDWHERAWLNRATGEQERQRVETCAFCYGSHITTDYENGRVYLQTIDYPADHGQEIRATRAFKGPAISGRNIIIDELRLDLATGVGLDGSPGIGVDPYLMLRTAPEGVAFGTEMTAPMGKIGQSETQVRFFELGVGRQWVFEVSVSDPVVIGLSEATVVYREGTR